MASIILTLIGPDRPGLVSTLAEQVAALGGSWQESRMARLAGQFAGILQVEVSAGRVDDLIAGLRKLEGEGLRVAVERDPGTTAPAPQQPLGLELTGHDRPGIVRDITKALAARGINIEELSSEVASGQFSGEQLFRAALWLDVPAGVRLEEVRGLLEALANDLMVDITLQRVGQR